MHSAGGEIASTFDKPESVKLGSCKLIEEIMIGEDKLIHFSGVAMGEACTIILRGASESLLLAPTAGDACTSHLAFPCWSLQRKGVIAQTACVAVP